MRRWHLGRSLLSKSHHWKKVAHCLTARPSIRINQRQYRKTKLKKSLRIILIRRKSQSQKNRSAASVAKRSQQCLLAWALFPKMSSHGGKQLR